MKERLWIYSAHSKTAEKKCLSRVAFSLCGVGFCFRRFPALDLRFLQHLRDRVHSTGLGKCGSVRILRHDVIRWAQVWVARLKSVIAVQPAKFTLDGKTVRPMGRETDKALELIKALTEEQRKQAILGAQMRDLVLGPGHDGETIQPEGVKTSTFNEGQRKLLLELVSEWSGIIHDTAAAAKMNEIKANLADTWFAWSGPLEAGKAYFRIQGPTVIIEYAPQRLGGDVTMHLHSMYRDPTNDYGKKFGGK